MDRNGDEDEAEVGEAAKVLAWLRVELDTVRRKHDEGVDNWRPYALHVICRFLRAVGTEGHLIVPLERLEAEAARLRQRGEKPRAIHTLALATAAAAVTMLNRQHGLTLEAATARISKVSDIPKAKLKAFRENLNRGPRHVPRGALEDYRRALGELWDRDYSYVLKYVEDLGVGNSRDEACNAVEESYRKFAAT